MIAMRVIPGENFLQSLSSEEGEPLAKFLPRFARELGKTGDFIVFNDDKSIMGVGTITETEVRLKCVKFVKPDYVVRLNRPIGGKRESEESVS